MKRLLGAVLALTSCLSGEEPPLEAAYREARSIVEATIEDAAPLLPTLAFGAPIARECIGKYEERADEIDVSMAVWIEYEEPSEGRAILEAAARSWRRRGLPVAPFDDGLTVFPDESGPYFRLDLELAPDVRRVRLAAQTRCLRPDSGIPPAAIPELGDDPRDLRGPAARADATVGDAARWAGAILARTAAQVGATARPEAQSQPAPCYQLASALPGVGAREGLPDLFTADRDAALDPGGTGATLRRIRRAWDEQGFDVEEGNVGGAPSVVARFGDFAFRARAAGAEVFLHASTPCLPKRGA